MTVKKFLLKNNAKNLFEIKIAFKNDGFFLMLAQV